jgi:AraC family transcriptional regulator
MAKRVFAGSTGAESHATPRHAMPESDNAQRGTSGFPGRPLANCLDLGCSRIQAWVIDVMDNLEWIYTPRLQHIIVCILSPRRVTREAQPVETTAGERSSGRVSFLPAGCAGVLRGPAGRRVLVCLDQEILEEARRKHATRAAAHPELIAAIDVRDAFVEELCELLVAELATPRPGSKLVFEGAAMVLMAHLLRSCSRMDPLPARAPRGLRWKSRERLLEALRADILPATKLRDLAAIAGLSRFHFSRQFKLSFGATPRQFLENERMNRAKAMIREGKLRYSDVAMVLGYSEHSHFTRRFKANTGSTPTEFARAGRPGDATP